MGLKGPGKVFAQLMNSLEADGALNMRLNDRDQLLRGVGTTCSAVGMLLAGCASGVTTAS
jgi:hypothetical protein